MKKLFLLFIVFLALSSCDKNLLESFFQSEIKICNLYEKQSAFDDKLVELYQLKVTKCSGVFSVYYVEVTDGKCSINLFTKTPYAINEIIDIEAKYKVLFNHDGESISILVTDDFPLQPNKLLNLLL